MRIDLRRVFALEAPLIFPPTLNKISAGQQGHSAVEAAFGIARIDLQALFEVIQRAIQPAHIQRDLAHVVQGQLVVRINGEGTLKAGQCLIQIVSRMPGVAQLDPGIGITGIQGEDLLVGGGGRAIPPGGVMAVTQAFQDAGVPWRQLEG